MNEFTQHDIEAIQKKTALLQRMTDLLLSDILVLYKSGQYVDMNPEEKRHAAFSDRIPVWLIWWQGEDEMPALVKACYSSLKRALPYDICEIHLITAQNITDYINLPEWIITKYNAGIISVTHLSDIIRMALLSDYGGLYLDATYYLVEKIPEDFFTGNDFFTLCNRARDWKDLVHGRWSGNFFYKRIQKTAAEPDAAEIFFKYIKNAFYYYWASQNQMNDYYLIDYVIDGAYRNIPGICELIDSVPDTNPNVADMVFALNEKYSEDRFAALRQDTGIFKLSNKITLSEHTADGDVTLYGRILEHEGVHF